eukprot:TRINITY_DN31014_c0_g1_i1.p1 TRINITY_DN31014_c0_g1~~TRINITY_DN31014_c0_g1_i1.p1  ORF type:complete len:359 (-),score=45.66 TRINITY_DN31014_c0_g1_i1:245-1321(-)
MPDHAHRRGRDPDDMEDPAKAEEEFEKSRSSRGRAQRFLQTHRNKFYIGIFIWFVVWYYLLERHGTLFPPFVAFHVATYQGPAAGPWPPDGFVPPRDERIVVTLTTRPDRLAPGMLNPTLDSIFAQDLKPDVVYLNIPPGLNKRTGQEYVIPEDLSSMKGLKIIRAEDKGPLTKLYPALEAEDDPRTIVISVDDDKLYSKHLVRTLVWHLNNAKNTAFSCCGWSLWWWPNHFQHVGPVPYFMRTLNGVYMDVLQGVCGNAYRRGFFDVAELAQPPEECYTVDDLWIAGYLMGADVKRAVINAQLDPQKRTEVNEASAEFALSTGNSKGLSIYDDCVAAVEARYGTWKRARNYQNDRHW